MEKTNTIKVIEGILLLTIAGLAFIEIIHQFVNLFTTGEFDIFLAIMLCIVGVICSGLVIRKLRKS